MGKMTKEELATLARLNAGDSVVYSQDGDDGWFTGGDRAFVGNEIIRLRKKGLIERVVDDEENYRGMSERDVISDAGRSALEEHNGKPGDTP